MTTPSASRHSLEILEQRIAPAALLNEAGFETVLVGTPLLLTAGKGLATGGPKSGSYMLYVEKGTALVFTTDLNNNQLLDSNEITGIAAGDGLRLISFVDIHGDIVTNLRPDSKLSDSDNNTANDDDNIGGDGRVLLDSRIEKIELRSLSVTDIDDQDGIGLVGPDGKIIPDQVDVELRLALSTYSLHGNIYAGGGFGVPGDATSGLLINTAGRIIQQAAYNGADFFIAFKPTIGSIKTGTAASGSYFQFGASNKIGDAPGKFGDIQGHLATFVPATGKPGGDIAHIRSVSGVTSVEFNLDSLETGDGGIGARGGNISNIALDTDSAGGYRIIAGDGGRGVNGGAGGSITALSDAGSVTGLIVIQTGDGGIASTGIGGNGGNLALGQMDPEAPVTIQLGNGGLGFTAGGNGASLTSANFVVPGGTASFGAEILANTRDRSTGLAIPGDAIGKNVPVDFNERNVNPISAPTPAVYRGDYLFTSAIPDQLIVVLDGNIATTRTLDLPALDDAGNPAAVVVGDFNDDGHQDIAAASGAAGSTGGIFVWLNEGFFDDTDGNGMLSASEDRNGNGFNDYNFTGFSAPIRNPLPYLAVIPGFTGFFRAAISVGDIAAGDFDGDGHTELAVSATYYSASNVANGGNQVVVFMQPNFEDADLDPAVVDLRPTGQFFADFGDQNNRLEPVIVVNPRDPSSPSSPGSTKIEATRLTTDAHPLASVHPYDVLIVGNVGDRGLSTIAYSTPSATGPTIIGTWSLGQVDVDRQINNASDPHLSLQPAELLDFTIVDIRPPIPTAGGGPSTPDGIADIVVLTQTPTPDFLVAIAGGNTVFVNVGDPPTTLGGQAAGGLISDALGTNQNAGIALAEGANTTLNVGSPIVAIKTTDSDNLNGKNDVVVLSYDTSPGGFTAEEIVFTVRAAPTNTGGTRTQILFRPPTNGDLIDDPAVIAWEPYTQVITNPGTVDYLAANATKDPAAFNGITLASAAGRSSFTYVTTGFTLNAGDGGSALVGRGGTGGSIGSGLRNVAGVITGAVDITLSSSNTPVVTFSGGNGGNGFSTGGLGGDVSGVRVVANASVQLVAGNGGFGVSGNGGAGGDVRAISVTNATLIQAGSGGRGLVGGAGGSVLGNGIANLPDFITGSSPQILSGSGGDGVRAGGHAGDVTNLHPLYTSSGSFIVTAGAGGTAISGVGGRGGSITNLSPQPSTNRLNLEIFLHAGAGGFGVTGGAGGVVRNFTTAPSSVDNPDIFSFLGGHGGGATLGNAGAGGAVENITAPSIGRGSIGGNFSQHQFDRVLAGNGGNSAGGSGGAGGRISALSVDASDGSLVIVAGAGGTGLTNGGDGGSVVSTRAAVGGSVNSKMLVIAGKGGDVTSVVPNSNDATLNQAEKSFGGKVGQAGDGGSITAFRQDLGTATRIDLIAGNGGDTLNYGTTALTEKSYVGKGGSISNVNATGNLGNSDRFVALRSYNNTADTNGDGRPDQTVADFVEATLRNGSLAAFTDSLGNVGVIVGAAGRIKTIQTGSVDIDPGVPVLLKALFDTQPSGSALNGSLIEINARNLASAVAGSIDRLAAITLVSGLRIGSQTSPSSPFSPGTVGADKEPVATGGPPFGFNYFTRSGGPIPAPILDGALTQFDAVGTWLGGDGAVVTRKLVVLGGDPNPVGRVFIV